MKQILYFMVGAIMMASCQSVGENQSLRKTLDNYEKCFNTHNAKELGLFWDKEGEYFNPRTNESIIGRANIISYYETFFKHYPQAKLNITTESLTFPKEDEAVQITNADLTHMNGPSLKVRYQTHFEKKKGEWLIKKMTELKLEQANPNTEYLKEIYN